MEAESSSVGREMAPAEERSCGRPVPAAIERSASVAGIDNEGFEEESGAKLGSVCLDFVSGDLGCAAGSSVSVSVSPLRECVVETLSCVSSSGSAEYPPSPAVCEFSRRRPVRFKTNPVRLRSSGQASTSGEEIRNAVDKRLTEGINMTTTSGSDPRPERRRGRHPPPPPPPSLQQAEFTQLHPDPVPEMLPDILNSHLPPPYTTLPDRSGSRRFPPPVHPPPPPPGHHGLCPAAQCPPSPPVGRPGRPGARSRSTSSCHPFPSRGRLRSSGRAGSVETDEPKHCCGVMVTQTVSIRWFIVMIAFVGLCCAIVGTVLGALKATGREHLTVSLLMIGVGIVLITVSGIAWRLTSHDAPSCRAMLGLQPANEEPNRRFMPRVPPYGRPPHPYAAMLYPEFQYRPPPPSYQASMQEYRLRLLLLDRQQGTTAPPTVAAPIIPAPSSSAAVPNSAPTAALSPVSPPPTYRSYASSTLHSRPPLNFNERDFSRPPSYRSRASSVAVLRPGATDTLDSRRTLGSMGYGEHPGTGYQTELSATPGTPPNLSSSHSRDPSLTLSFLSHDSLFGEGGRPCDLLPPVDAAPLLTSPSGESRTSLVAGLSDESPVALPVLPVLPPPTWKDSAVDSAAILIRKHPDVNTVTIVQTTDSSQVHNQDTVIVAVTGHAQQISAVAGGSAATTVLPSSGNGEVQILAQV